MHTLQQMRLGAEFEGRTYVSGHYTAKSTDGLKFWSIIVRVSLVPGYSGRDHMFDLTLARAANLLARVNCFSSAGACVQYLNRHLGGTNGRADVSIEDDDLGYAAEADITDQDRAMAQLVCKLCVAESNLRRRKADVAAFGALRPVREASHWRCASDKSAWAGLMPVGAGRVGSPTQEFRTENEARAALADRITAAKADLAAAKTAYTAAKKRVSEAQR